MSEQEERLFAAADPLRVFQAELVDAVVVVVGRRADVRRCDEVDKLPID